MNDIETKLSLLEGQLTLSSCKLDTLTTSVNKLVTKVDAIEDARLKERGFLRGAVWMAAGLWALVILGLTKGDAILQKLIN